jgi:hypothetical protein
MFALLARCSKGGNCPYVTAGCRGEGAPDACLVYQLALGLGLALPYLGLTLAGAGPRLSRQQEPQVEVEEHALLVLAFGIAQRKSG